MVVFVVSNKTNIHPWLFSWYLTRQTFTHGCFRGIYQDKHSPMVVFVISNKTNMDTTNTTMGECLSYYIPRKQPWVNVCLVRYHENNHGWMFVLLDTTKTTMGKCLSCWWIPRKQPLVNVCLVDGYHENNHGWMFVLLDITKTIMGECFSC
jgi:hypothetical protein